MIKKIIVKKKKENPMKQKRIVTLVLTLALCLLPLEAFAGEKAGNIVSTKDTKYSYQDMVRDLKKLAQQYPETTGLESLGKTADKREIYCLRMGNPEADKQIIVQACIHAREWLNCQVLMKMTERYLANYETGTHKGVTYQELFDEVAVYIVPMVNPDGVTISQYGISKIKNKALRKKLKKMKKNGAYKRWKANARGVDLNRSFPASWAKKRTEKKPASDGYAGKKAGSEAETKAIIKLIGRLPNLKACVNYHSMGELIYWGAKGKGQKRKDAYELASMVHKTTGYRLVDESKTYGAGGDLERYLISKEKLPYVCIETGSQNCPLPHKAFNGIYKKNKTIIEKTAYLYY